MLLRASTTTVTRFIGAHARRDYVYRLAGKRRGVSYDSPPALISAAGVRAWDKDGREYFDFSAWDAPLGHSPPSVVAALAAQSATLGNATSSGMPHVGSEVAAGSLCRVLRADKAVLLEGYGAGPALAAKVARHCAASRGSKARKILHVRAAPLSQTVYAHRLASVGFGDLSAVEVALHEGSVAAIVVEPLQLQAGGFIPVSDGFLKSVAVAARRAGVVLISDERRSSLGRTGSLLAFDGSSDAAGAAGKRSKTGNLVEGPDLILLGRGAVSGLMPFEAVLARGSSGSALLEALHAFTPPPTSSSAASPISCAAAHATVELVETTAQRALRADADTLGTVLRKRLRRRIPEVDNAEIPLSVRGRGLLSAVTVGRVGDGIARDVALRMAQTGILSEYVENVIFLAPPLGITEREVAKASRVIRSAIQDVSGVRRRATPRTGKELLQMEMMSASRAAAAHLAVGSDMHGGEFGAERAESSGDSGHAERGWNAEDTSYGTVGA